MNLIEAIQGDIERLSSNERAILAAWLQEEFGVPDCGVTEPPAPAYIGRQRRRMSVEEYLDLEDPAGLLYEYVAGEIFAMTGTTGRHGKIVQNLCVAFGKHLEGGPCHVFSSSTKVRLSVSEDDIFYCPDVMVVCGKIDLEGLYYTDPRLVVEVISPSTEFTDRREKALHYRQAAALEECVLIAQKTPEVTIYRRSDKWQPQVLTDAQDIVYLRSIELKMPLSKIYEGVWGG